MVGMLSLVVGPLLGFVATGAVSRVSENRCRMLLEPSAFFLLSKIDLSQVRLEREALEQEISQLDARIVVGQQQAAAASTPATAPGGGLDVVAALLHPISPLLPIPALAVPMAALYYAMARTHSPAQATAGSAALYYPSSLLERGGAAARVRAAPSQTLTLTPRRTLNPRPHPQPSPNPDPHADPDPNLDRDPAAQTSAAAAADQLKGWVAGQMEP